MASTEDSCVVVCDVGGSHISAAVCFGADYRLGPVVRAGLPARQNSDAFVDVLYALGTKAANGEKSVLGAGLAMPGPFDYQEGVSRMRHKLPYLYGVNLGSALAERFGWKPDRVRFLNDAAAYLLGEVGAGAARDVPRAVGITLGTGVGSAFAVNGRIVTEGIGVPPGGEIWNVPYEGGIVEDLISTRAIQRGYRERTGKDREVAAIAAGTTEGDAAAVEVFEEFGRNLGRALKTLTSAFAPEVIVLGGGISLSAHLFLPSAQRALEAQHVELRVSSLMDVAALVGAGVAWFTKSAGPG
jgi:glucokinase